MLGNKPEIYAFDHRVGFTSRPLKLGEDCEQMIRNGDLPVCSECGSVVAHPMVHREWHQKMDRNDST